MEQPETKAETPAEEPKAVETPKTPDVPKKEEAPKETAPVSTQKEVEVFTLKSDRRTVARPNVIGTIDLSAINQSTRPKKKSKEEKRKEREEKAQVSADRKKRVRIGKERVDINDAANQQQGGKNGKNARTTQGQPNPNQPSGNKKKNKKKGNQQPQDFGGGCSTPGKGDSGPPHQQEQPEQEGRQVS